MCGAHWYTGIKYIIHGLHIKWVHKTVFGYWDASLYILSCVHVFLFECLSDVDYVQFLPSNIFVQACVQVFAQGRHCLS